jgi:hypothetical protein
MIPTTLGSYFSAPPVTAFQLWLFACWTLLYSYDIGATSFVLEQLKSATLSGVSWHGTVHDSSLLQGTITSGAVLGE